MLLLVLNLDSSVVTVAAHFEPLPLLRQTITNKVVCSQELNIYLHCYFISYISAKDSWIRLQKYIFIRLCKAVIGSQRDVK